MLRLAAIAVVGVVSAAAGAQMMISFANDRQASVARPADPTITPALNNDLPASGDAAEVMKSNDGHYWADASVGGHQVHFLVDTGASAVALTPEDAERLGIDPSSLTYGFTVSTASGQARAAQVTLPSVAVGQAEVDNVQAYVIESGLKQSLLGMSYLGRLSQFEATKTALILRP